MRVLKNILIFCVNTILITQAYAMQEVKVKDGDTVTAKFSKNELTRITASGKAEKITDVWSGNDYFDTQVDETTGSVFIQPHYDAPNVFSFFVQDNTESVYTVIANLQDIPSDTVKFNNVRPKKSYVVQQDSLSETASSVGTRKREIRDLMYAMYNSDDTNYYIEPKNEVVPLWNETKITHIATFVGQNYTGDAYELVNISEKPMVLKETEFLYFGENVEAISLDVTHLEPNDNTIMFIVRSINNSEG